MPPFFFWFESAGRGEGKFGVLLVAWLDFKSLYFLFSPGLHDFVLGELFGAHQADKKKEKKHVMRN